MLKSTAGAWETHYHKDATADSANIWKVILIVALNGSLYLIS